MYNKDRIYHLVLVSRPIRSLYIATSIYSLTSEAHRTETSEKAKVVYTGSPVTTRVRSTFIQFRFTLLTGPGSRALTLEPVRSNHTPAVIQTRIRIAPVDGRLTGSASKAEK